MDNRESEKKKILFAFEACYYKIILKIGWIDHITNEEIFRRVAEERSFLKALKIRRVTNGTYTTTYDITIYLVE